MKLLAGKCYDPAAAVTKATTALLAMTAFDTTNLRLSSITVPDHGMLRWRIVCCVHGATTLPSVLLGVLEGATVRARLAPMVGGGNLIATGRYQLEATGLITGLTPGGSVTLDAAYGVEIIVASTGIKYGGPNNTTTNDAFGGIVFEIFDPAPEAGSGSGATAQEVWEYATRTLTANPGLSAAQVNAECDTAISDAALATAANLVTVDTIVDAIKLKTDNMPSDPADQSLIIAATNQIRTDIAGLPTAASIHAEMTELENLDAAVSTRMATFTYTEPDNTGIAAIQAKTDAMNFTLAGKLDTNVLVINGVTVTGEGTEASRWRGAA